jgi:hypothetical protein
MFAGKSNVEPLGPKLDHFAINDLGAVDNESNIQPAAADIRHMLARATLEDLEGNSGMVRQVPLQ